MAHVRVSASMRPCLVRSPLWIWTPNRHRRCSLPECFARASSTIPNRARRGSRRQAVPRKRERERHSAWQMEYSGEIRRRALEGSRRRACGAPASLVFALVSMVLNLLALCRAGGLHEGLNFGVKQQTRNSAKRAQPSGGQGSAERRV